MSIQMRDLNVGAKCRVVGFKRGATAYREKLLAMGLTKGTEFRVERVAPMGDPVEINLRGFALSLRKDEADAVIVEKECE